MLHPDYWLIKIDETSYWNDDVLSATKKILGVYAFDRNLHVHICSFTPMYEMHFLASDYEEVDGMSYEKREELSDLILEGDCQSEPITYMNVSSIENCLKRNTAYGSKVTGLDTEEDSIEQIYEGWATGSLTY